MRALLVFDRRCAEPGQGRTKYYSLKYQSLHFKDALTVNASVLAKFDNITRIVPISPESEINFSPLKASTSISPFDVCAARVKHERD